MKKRSIFDKIVFFATFAATVVLFIIDKFNHFIYDDATKEGLELLVGIEVIGCLSFFFGILSFAWDKKFQIIKKGILIGNTNNEEKPISVIHKELDDSFQGLKSSIASLLRTSKNSVTDMSLSEKECDLDKFLNIDHSNEYAVIYIITNSISVELDDFEDPIRKNILNDVQYVYMTPLNDTDFDISLRDKIIDNDTEHKLCAAYRKNIHHISNPKFFEGLPAYSDMVIYTKRQNIDRGAGRNFEEGYFCFQNGAIEETINTGANQEKIATYFYQEMSMDLTQKILNIFDNTFWNSICSSYISDKIEIRESNISGKGFFVKQGMSIEKEEVIFIKGGYFQEKEAFEKQRDSSRKDPTLFQIQSDTFLGGLNTNIDQFTLFANHDCNPNCILKDKIVFVAKEDLKENEEIFVNYLSLSNRKYKFGGKFVCQNKNCNQHDKKHCKYYGEWN